MVDPSLSPAKMVAFTIHARSTQQDLKGEVQTLARVLDSSSSSLASLTADSLADVNRLADQAARCKSAIGALDGLCQVNRVVAICGLRLGDRLGSGNNRRHVEQRAAGETGR